MLAIWNNPFHNERTTVLGDLNRIISFWDFFFRFENVQVNFTNKNGQNSLYYAQKNQSEEMCSLLISNGAKQRTPSNKYIKSNSFSRKVINEAADWQLNLHHDNITEKTSFVAGYKKVWCSKEFKQTKKSGW